MSLSVGETSTLSSLGIYEKNSHNQQGPQPFRETLSPITATRHPPTSTISKPTHKAKMRSTEREREDWMDDSRINENTGQGPTLHVGGRMASMAGATEVLCLLHSLAALQPLMQLVMQESEIVKQGTERIGWDKHLRSALKEIATSSTEHTPRCPSLIHLLQQRADHENLPNVDSLDTLATLSTHCPLMEIIMTNIQMTTLCANAECGDSKEIRCVTSAPAITIMKSSPTILECLLDSLREWREATREKDRCLHCGGRMMEMKRWEKLPGCLVISLVEKDGSMAGTEPIFPLWLDSSALLPPHDKTTNPPLLQLKAVISGKGELSKCYVKANGQWFEKTRDAPIKEVTNTFILSLAARHLFYQQHVLGEHEEWEVGRWRMDEESIFPLFQYQGPLQLSSHNSEERIVPPSPIPSDIIADAEEAYRVKVHSRLSMSLTSFHQESEHGPSSLSPNTPPLPPPRPAFPFACLSWQQEDKVIFSNTLANDVAFFQQSEWEWLEAKCGYLLPTLDSIPLQAIKQYQMATQALLIPIKELYARMMDITTIMREKQNGGGTVEREVEEMKRIREELDMAIVFYLEVHRGIIRATGTSLGEDDFRIKKVTPALLTVRLTAITRILSFPACSPMAQQQRGFLLLRLRWEEEQIYIRLKEMKEKSEEGMLTRARDKEKEDKSRARRAKRLIEKGAISAAAQQLHSSMKMADTNDMNVRNTLANLHPARPENTVMPEPPSDIPLCEIDRHDLAALPDSIINDRKSPGTTGLAGIHYLPLLRCHATVDGIAAIMEMIANDQLPPMSKKWLNVSKLVALEKPVSGVRPIAVSEFLVRITGKILKARIKMKIVRELFPEIQMGLEQAGIDRAIHLQQIMWEEVMKEGEDLAVLSIDHVAAYQNLDRAFMLETLFQQPSLATIFHYIQGIYCDPSGIALYNTGKMVMALQSAQGCRQGCVFGPLLFSLAMHQKYIALRKSAREYDAAQARQHPSEEMAFLDDVTVVGHPTTVMYAMQQYSLDMAPGMAINFTKSSLTTAKDTGRAWEESAGIAEGMGMVVATGHTKSLGAWIGTKDRIMMEEIERKYGTESKAYKGVNMLVRVKDQDLPVQHKLLLLRMSFNAMLVHLLRTTPPEMTRHICIQYDNNITDAAMSILGIQAGEQTRDVRDQLSRPIRHGGFGLTSATKVAAAAYVASVTTTILVDKNGVVPVDIPTRKSLEMAWTEIITCIKRGGEDLMQRFKRTLSINMENDPSYMDFVNALHSHTSLIASAAEELEKLDDTNNNTKLFHEARRKILGLAFLKDGGDVDRDGCEERKNNRSPNKGANGTRKEEEKRNEKEMGFDKSALHRIRPQQLLTRFMEDADIAQYYEKRLDETVSADNAFEAEGGINALCELKLGNRQSDQQRLQRLEILRIHAHRTHASLAHLRSHLDTSGNTWLNIIPTCPQLRIFNQELRTAARNRLDILLVPGEAACTARHTDSNKRFNFSLCANQALTISKHHRDYCMHGVGHRRTIEHDGVVEALNIAMSSAGCMTTLSPKVRQFTLLSLLPAPLPVMRRPQQLQHHPPGDAPLLANPTHAPPTLIDPHYMHVDGQHEGDEDMSRLINDQRHQRELIGDIGSFASAAAQATLVDVVVTAPSAPSYLLAAYTRLHSSRTSPDKLGIAAHMEAHEVRKRRHYAHFLSEVSDHMAIRTARTYTEVFTAADINFVPAAMSIYGHRGKALDDFLATLAFMTPTFFDLHYSLPFINPRSKTTLVQKTKEYYRALISIGLIRGLTRANTRLTSPTLFDSNKNSAPFFHLPSSAHPDPSHFPPDHY